LVVKYLSFSRFSLYLYPTKFAVKNNFQ